MLVVSLLLLAGAAFQLRRMIRQLSQDEEFYRRLFTDVNDGLLLIDRDGPILTANPAACLMTGYSEEALCQRSLCDLVPPDTTPVLLPLAAKNQSGSRELDVVRKDGSRFAAEMRIYPITLPDGQGEERAVLGVIEDIS
jgi:PAS domain S-box-containing protein